MACAGGDIQKARCSPDTITGITVSVGSDGEFGFHAVNVSEDA